VEEKNLDSNNISDFYNADPSPDCEFFNGFGCFVEDGKEYEIILDGKNKPPSPWINVIANKRFGFQVSESGAGYSWAYNSRENKLTPWSNDPVSDNAPEILYIKDEATGDIMTPMSYGRTDRGSYRIRHGHGYSIFYHKENNIEQELTLFTPLSVPVKLWALKLNNTSGEERQLSLALFIEWVLGVDRESTNPYILSSYNNEYQYFTARNTYNHYFRNYNAFMFSSEEITDYTGDMREFIGKTGSLLNPEGMNKMLSGDTGVCFDPCGVIKASVTLSANESKTIVFGLGYCDEFDKIKVMLKKYKEWARVQKELRVVKTYWKDLLGKVKIKTNDRAIDILFNEWLLYQTLSCRINGRTGFYQSGGAYGYRDQIQDALALLDADPNTSRELILMAAGRQFEEGDVQHWWHPPIGIGVRTRISDDLLWLPYVTAEYIKSTGDKTILSENVPYIKGPTLEDGQKELMFIPEISNIKASVYEHCKKAIQHAGYGIHGLPLMGGGDWNDGMNEVGIEGKGESVWLGWFIYSIIDLFIPLCNQENDTEFAQELDERKQRLKNDMEEYAWDGEWYLRAFYDDYSKLGSKENDECKIDSISQSWSVISGAADKDRATKALESAQRFLVRKEDGVSLLLFPPFDKTEKNPGYIKNYYPGIRENGGQYTHAAIWLAIANAKIGNYSQAYSHFSMLNPILTTSKKEDAIKYEREPYVMVADISITPPYKGRGGWSWYTGAAGWMYQGLLKWFLGIKREGEFMIIDPKTPADFGKFSVEYIFGATTYTINVNKRVEGFMTTDEVTVDGKKIAGNKILLKDDKIPHVVVV
jgi:cellobiose phosphorylase